MTQEQEIKGILVKFFRDGTNGDYLDALNTAIKEIEQVKNCNIADVVGRSEQFCECDGVQDLIAGTGECRKCGKECTY